MRVEQILYTRIGGSEIGAGWQTRTSEKFDSDAEKGCTYQFNCIVDSLLDKSRQTPEYIYTMWHANKRLCSARTKKLSDQSGRGNILAQAYVINESEYISVLSQPTKFLCISEFYDEIVEQPPVLDKLPSSEGGSLREICQKYSISAAKMQQLMVLILSAMLRKSAHKKALKIVINKSMDELYKASQEIMSAVFSFMPCVVGMNASFASFAHEKLEGLSVLFTNETPDNYYYNLETGEYSWPENMLIPAPEMAKVFIENKSNTAFQKDIEDFVLQAGYAYNLQWENLMAAYLYASIKNNIKISTSEDELFKALALALKNTSSGICESYLSKLLVYYLDNGGKVSTNHAEILTARYTKTKDEELKSAIDYYNFTNYISDFSEQKFAKFCSLQKNAPDIYNSTVTKAIELKKDTFLRKVSADIAKTKDTHAIFEKSVTTDTKQKMYRYIVDNIYCSGDSEGYAAFAELRKRVPELYSALHTIAIRFSLDSIKAYYSQYYIPEIAESLDSLAEIKETFSSKFDENLKNISQRKALEIFKSMCQDDCQTEKYIKYKDTMQKLGGGNTVNFENEGKQIFWKNFSLSSWKYNDNYGILTISGNPLCDRVKELGNMVKKLQNGMNGDNVYDYIIHKIIHSTSLDKNERYNIIRQIQYCIPLKTNVRGNVDDIVLSSIDAATARVNLQLLQEGLEKQARSINEMSIRNSVMLNYVIGMREYRPLVIELYKRLSVGKKFEKPRVLEAFVKVCASHGINMKKVQSDIEHTETSTLMISSLFISLVALSTGLGLGLLQNKMLEVLSSETLLQILNTALIVMFSVVISLPAVRTLKQAINSKSKEAFSVLALILFVIALMTFAVFFNIWAAVVAAIMLILNIIFFN